MAEREKRRATTFITSRGAIINVAAPSVYIAPGVTPADVTSPTELRKELTSPVSLEIKPDRRMYEYDYAGIPNLISFKGDLYGLMAMRCEVLRFMNKGAEVVYDFKDFGSPPRSGGDSWGASAVWHDELYFGGWLNAPPTPSFYGDPNFFSQKRTHIIKSPDGDSWKKVYERVSPNNQSWHGEITDMLVFDEEHLYCARGDYHDPLGVGVERGIWVLNRQGNLTQPAPLVAGRWTKLAQHEDWLITADIDTNNVWGYNSETGATELYPLTNQKGPDGVNDVNASMPVSCYWWGKSLLVFDNRGVFIGDPINVWGCGWTPRTAFIPLFLDPTARTIGHSRVKPAYVNGKIITACNTQAWPSFLPGPICLNQSSYLLEIGDTIRIIGKAGGYSSICLHGGKLYVASSNYPITGHLGWRPSGIINVTPIDLGLLESSSIQPPIHDWVWNGAYTAGTSGWKGFFGGYPTTGYKDIITFIYTSVPNTLTVYFTDLIQSNAPSFQVETLATMMLDTGGNNIDLSQFGRLNGIIFFRLDSSATIRFYLGMTT